MAHRGVASLKIAMTIAGSDSGGGAGIQADLKTFHQFGVYGASVVTAITAQNTLGISGIHPVPPDLVAEQYLQIVSELDVTAAKTGMLVNTGIITALAEILSDHPLSHLVVDPVIFSGRGSILLDTTAAGILIERIFPLATVVTPNLEEAAFLIDSDPIESLDEMISASEKIRAMGPGAVLIKGGHLPMEEDAVDLLYDGVSSTEFRSPRHERKQIHGTGCTLSAAITASLAKGRSLAEAILSAKNFITDAIRNAPDIGKGQVLLNHFVETDRSES